MPISYTTDENLRLITETWLGDVTFVDLVEHWTLLLEDPRNLAIRRSLADVRRASFKFSAEQLEAAIKTTVLPLLNDRDWIAAIVVRSVAQFRMTRHYQLLAQSYSYDVLFSNLEDATAWLLRQEPRV